MDEEEEGACLSRNSFDVNVVSLVILGGTGVAVEELLGTLAEFAFNEERKRFIMLQGYYRAIIYEFEEPEKDARSSVNLEATIVKTEIL